MKMKKLLKIFIFMFGFAFFCLVATAQDNMAIIPSDWWEDRVIEAVNNVSQWGKVIENYKKEAWNLSLWQQLSSGIMNWDTILDYCAYLAKFLWQVALLVWAFLIIYIWYEKIIKSVISDQTTKIGKIIIWILVIIFAYVIIKLIWSAFIS